jgi:hypothetical protein
VVRKCRRHDGWTPASQRRYVVGLAETGNVDQAAHRVKRTASGAWKVRTSDKAEDFAAAWDGALALHHRRNPRPLPKGRPSRGEILAGSGRAWPARVAPPRPAPELDPAEERKAWLEWVHQILRRYWLKLGCERKARLAGRIAEADYYARQLTHIEVIIDIGGRSLDLLNELQGGRYALRDIVATPMSLLLDGIRRTFWREGGEPERPPLPPLGEHDGEVALGERKYFHSDRDGDYQAWVLARKAQAGVDAEAQRLWEEKAAKEAEAWRKRLEGEEGETGAEPGAEEKGGNSGSRATRSGDPEARP